MRTSTLFAMAAAGGARLAAAHATVFAIWVNGEDQGLGNTADGYIRSPPNNNPVMDVTSTDMTCNVNGAKAAGKFASVAGGDKITVEWHHNNRDASDDIIADSHKGPIMTYLAPAESNGEGDVWLKIQEEGYSGGKWAVDNLIANKGKYDITLPNLAAGQYLLRSEVLALHEGNRQGGAQWYMECIQLEVTSSGSVTLPAGVAIPGAYKADDAGVLFDIYNSFTSYPIPGPALWDGASSGGSTPAPASSAAPVASSAAPVASSAAPATSATPNATPAPATSAAPAASSAAPAPQQPSAKPTTLATVVKPSASCTKSGSKPTPSAGTGNGSTATVQKYGQCGGKNYSGSTSCAEGWTCKAWNDYYSQCVQA